MRVNVDGRVLAGDGQVEASALYIHGRMHIARPDVRCILHTHMPYATALTSIAGARLEPINQNALRFNGCIAYDKDYGGLALEPPKATGSPRRSVTSAFCSWQIMA